MPLPTTLKQNEIAALIQDAKFLRKNAADAIAAATAGPVLTPSLKTEPRNVRESNRPGRPERILYEEAT
jgi:hypothetical protein